MSDAESSRKRPRNNPCLSCKSRQIECNAALPKCAACIASNSRCIYTQLGRPLRPLQPAVPATPSTPDVNKLQDQVNELESKLRRMEQSLNLAAGASRPVAGASQSSHALVEPKVEPESVKSSESSLPSSSPAVSVGSDHAGLKYRLTVDDTGNVVYHGLTSLDQGPNLADQGTTHSAPPTAGLTDPAFSPLFLAMATSKHISVAPELGNALLECFFCYQDFNVVQPSVFLRDMALGGPFFSNFLLMSIYTSSTRMIDGLSSDERRTQGDIFARLAREMLTKELEGPSKVTIAQGLLLLSGRECALGNVSQGWNHAGLAFRIIQDLGIHLTPNTLAGSSMLSAEEQANRDRLFWSAFAWDKVISLSLGRDPTFSPRQGRDPSSIADFDDDTGPWTPYFANPLNRPKQLATYTYEPVQRIAAFRHMSQLFLILHDLIVRIYSSEGELSPDELGGFVMLTRHRLERLWEGIPPSMKPQPGAQSLPPFIFLLLMLYHTTWILLWRPSFSDHDIFAASGYVLMCVQHSVAANELVRTYAATFSRRMAYLGTYCSFVISSFDVHLLRAGRQGIQMDALSRLRSWLETVDLSASHAPAIRRSVQTILSQTAVIIASNLVLGASEHGQWILDRHAHSQPMPEALPQDITRQPDFLDMLGPVQGLAPYSGLE